MKKTYYPGIIWLLSIIGLAVCVWALVPMGSDMKGEAIRATIKARYVGIPIGVFVIVLALRARICFYTDKIFISDGFNFRGGKRKVFVSETIFINDIKSIVFNEKNLFIILNNNIKYELSLYGYQKKDEIIKKLKEILTAIESQNQEQDCLVSSFDSLN